MTEEVPRVAVWNSPLSYHENSTEKFGFGRKKAGDRHDRAAKFMPNVVLGPMPVKDFLSEFLQRPLWSLDLMPSTENAFDEVPSESSTESTIYEPLVEALNKEDRCPGFTFRITASHPDNVHGRRGGMAPDICCYSNEHAELEQVKITSSQTESRTFMGYTAFFIEVKKKPGLDPYRDPPPANTDRSTWKFTLNHVNTNLAGEQRATSDTINEEMTRSLGQNTTYATEIFARQHRHCCFSATLSGSSARLIRWDRAGAIVTEAFDIRTSSGALHLCEFLWCFAHVGDARRGYDLTVMTATRIEKDLFITAINEHAKLQMSTTDQSEEAAAAMHCSEAAISVIEVPDSSEDADAVTEGVRRLLISRPIVYPYFLTGRATRAYWAVEAGTGDVVFLKDTWREDPPPSGRKEGETISYLRKCKVPYVPPIVCHADLHEREFVLKTFPDNTQRSVAENGDDHQATRTQKFLDAPWVCGTARTAYAACRALVKRRVHYRLVLAIAGHPLDRFNGSSELLSCAQSVLRGLYQASTLAGIGHRDITPENIIIYRKPKSGQDHKSHVPRKGYLVDWDLAWPLDKPLLEGGLPFSGTWQFVAESYRAGRPHEHKVEYDMESLLSVVFYCALLWLPHSARESVEYTFEEVFGGGVATSTGGARGGLSKTSAFADGSWVDEIVWECGPMQEWMAEMRRRFANQIQDQEKWSPLSVGLFWDEILKKPGLLTRDRIGELPPLDGRQKDGNIRYLGMAYCPSTVPTKRAFGDAMLGSTTSAAISTTFERNVRRRLADTGLSSMRKLMDHDVTPPATKPKARPAPSKAPDVALRDRRPPIKLKDKLQAPGTVAAKRRRDRGKRPLGTHTTSTKGKEKEDL
ncbi:hypothetical protein LXA43DRAFT_1092899 [Ganoderma leucocontextum]|nr:hypothetical protein LXA43DRAFT_1092899 [Ganoderma leucocontextum]